MEVIVAALVCSTLVGMTIAREVYRDTRSESHDSGWLLSRGGEDCNLDAIPDATAIAFGVNQDCDGNGIPDDCDIAGGVQDCNGNGVPDECELSSTNGLVGSYCGLFVGVEDNFEPLDNFEPFELCLGRIDPTVDFDWGDGASWPGFETDNFDVRWSGYVETPDVAGEYTFYTRTDDGVRLFVGGQLIIDDYTEHPAAERSGAIMLVANTKYRIVMEYFEAGGDAVAELRWEPPGQAKVIIPTERLFPGMDCNDNGVPDDCDVAGGMSPDANDNGIPDECELIVGDVDHDGDVDFDDLNLLLAAYGTCLGDAGYNAEADFDSSGCVDFDDLNLLLAHYGEGI